MSKKVKVIICPDDEEPLFCALMSAKDYYRICGKLYEGNYEAELNEEEWSDYLKACEKFDEWTSKIKKMLEEAKDE